MGKSTPVSVLFLISDQWVRRFVCTFSGLYLSRYIILFPRPNLHTLLLYRMQKAVCLTIVCLHIVPVSTFTCSVIIWLQLGCSPYLIDCSKDSIGLKHLDDILKTSRMLNLFNRQRIPNDPLHPPRFWSAQPVSYPKLLWKAEELSDLKGWEMSGFSNASAVVTKKVVVVISVVTILEFLTVMIPWNLISNARSWEPHDACVLLTQEQMLLHWRLIFC